MTAPQRVLNLRRDEPDTLDLTMFFKTSSNNGSSLLVYVPPGSRPTCVPMKKSWISVSTKS
uniref:Uncharacterized protein n=1 Tax=viral metagenome TaxID=1070528 RepID=A0A6C0BLZ7_9ZZZZ